MISALTGTQIGPRRQIAHAIFLAPRREDIGMLCVIAGQRADPVGAQELVFVEHMGQDPAQTLLVNESHDSPLCDAKMAGSGFMDRLAELRHALQALVKCRRQSGDALTLPFLYDRCGTER